MIHTQIYNKGNAVVILRSAPAVSGTSSLISDCHRERKRERGKEMERGGGEGERGREEERGRERVNASLFPYKRSGLQTRSVASTWLDRPRW